MWAPDRHILDSQAPVGKRTRVARGAPGANTLLSNHGTYWYVFATCPTPTSNAPGAHFAALGLPERAVDRAALCAKAANFDNPLNKSRPLGSNGQDLSNRFSGTVRCGLRIATSPIPRAVPRGGRSGGAVGMAPLASDALARRQIDGLGRGSPRGPPLPLRPPSWPCQGARSAAQFCAQTPQMSTTH